MDPLSHLFSTFTNTFCCLFLFKSYFVTVQRSTKQKIKEIFLENLIYFLYQRRFAINKRSFFFGAAKLI